MKTKAEETKEKKAPAPKKEFLAVVRIRGEHNISVQVKDTLKKLCLHRKNYCVVYPNTPSIQGMIQKVKDYVTWGKIDDATLKELIEKRGEKNPKDPKKTKSYFRLAPPRKGFGRAGIKKPFSQKGGLGDRKEKINDLVKRML